MGDGALEHDHRSWIPGTREGGFDTLLLGSSDLGNVGAQVRLGVPVIGGGKAPSLKISEELVLRAILVVPSPDLDLALWNSVVGDEEDDDRER
jgi:hypothetical protein